MVLWRGWCGTLKRVWYFEEGGVVLCRGWCITLKRVPFNCGIIVLKLWLTNLRNMQVQYAELIFMSHRYFEEGSVVLWRGLCGTLKRVWYFEEGGVVLWKGLCGTLKRVVWYFEDGDVVLWRGWCDTLKRVVWYFEEGCVVLWRWSCAGMHVGLSFVLPVLLCLFRLYIFTCFCFRKVNVLLIVWLPCHIMQLIKCVVLFWMLLTLLV